MNSGIKVVAPASISNLACGFDILGMAMDMVADEITGKWTDEPGIHITSMSGFKQGISSDPDQNIAGITAKALLHHLGESKRGIELKIHKHIPGGSGLGSSAASAVAAAFLVNELTGKTLEKKDLIPFALTGEMKASGNKVGDNVVASMIGGLVLVRDIETNDFHRIYMPPGLFIAVLLPSITIHTLKAREILRESVLFADVIKQSANLGSFVIGMQQSDLDLIRRSMQDHIIEPQRKSLIPHFDEVQQKALSMGALGCSISGAGPAIFALCQEKLQAEDIAAAMLSVYASQKMEARTFVTAVNHEGVRKM